jgi:predicted anti-sigma-YlaC factor YlaD
LQTPAALLSEEEYKEKEFLEKRSKNLYLRGRDIILNALNQKYTGFLEHLHDKKYDLALEPMRKEDVPFLYWAGAGWLGAFAIDPFDMKLGITLPKAEALMNRVKELDATFGDGAIHDFYVLYYGSLPEYMGGSLQKARHHFDKAIELSGGKTTSPYLSLATTVSVKEQNVREFKKLLEAVLKIDPAADPANTLLNTLNQRKARWLLEHLDDYFLLDDSEEGRVEGVSLQQGDEDK